DSQNEPLWIALERYERRRLSLNVFFGDTYGIETSRATNFAASIRSTITFGFLLSERKASYRIGRRGA
ncbi:MAG TPA: hypothetical protein VEU75_04370, partial [Candidatus Acidoferrum sp.]|nr:hypothetical protein [Candidatus Acidoferrum sp.]